jgi:transposase
MADASALLWQMEQRVPAGKTLGSQRGFRAYFRLHAGKTLHPRGGEVARAGQHLIQGAPRRARCVEKNGVQSIGKSRGGWNTKLHLASPDDTHIVEMHISGGECHDAPEGRKLIGRMGEKVKGIKARRKASGEKRPRVTLLMDKAHEGDETRALARKTGLTPVVPPKSNRVNPWKLNKKRYKQRNVVERMFRKLDNFRRIFTRYDKTDVIYMAYICFAATMICLK